MRQPIYLDATTACKTNKTLQGMNDIHVHVSIIRYLKVKAMRIRIQGKENIVTLVPGTR